MKTVTSRRGERGVTTIEYLVIMGMVVVVAMAGARRFGASVNGKADAQAEGVRKLEGGTGEVTAVAGGEGAAALCDGVGCACFVAGTPVATPNGRRPIETLRPGDLVLARSETTGAVDYRPVVRTFITPAKAVLDLEISAHGGATEVLGVTAEHPFYIDGRGWVRAGSLSVGEQGLCATGATLSMGAITERAEIATVYNLEVEEYHTYFVGRVGAWVHNQYVNGRWVGATREPGLATPPALSPPRQDNSLGGPDGVGGSSTRPRIGTIRPTADGGHYVLVHMQRPGYMPTNLVVPLPGATLMASGTPLAPAVWAGQIAGTGLWGAEWFAYLTDGTVWRYVPPPRPHPVIRAR